MALGTILGCTRLQIQGFQIQGFQIQGFGSGKMGPISRGKAPVAAEDEATLSRLLPIQMPSVLIFPASLVQKDEGESKLVRPRRIVKERSPSMLWPSRRVNFVTWTQDQSDSPFRLGVSCV